MCKRRIFTYTDLERLEKNEFFSELSCYPFITVSTDLQKGLNARYKRTLKYAARDSKAMVEAFTGSWSDEETIFLQYIKGREFFRKKLKESEVSAKQWLIGCRRNLKDMIRSIRMLAESGVSPEYIRPMNNEERLLKELWQYLLAEEPSFKQFKINIDNYRSKEAFQELYRKLIGEECEKVVFMGFYYITPLQERIMRLFEENGKEVIMFFHYDENASDVHKIWDKTYNEDNGYVPKIEWCIEKSRNRERGFSKLFEGSAEEFRCSANIIKYGTIIEFIEDVKRIRDEGYVIYSSDKHTANDILENFYPEEFQNRKLLSYPIGQYIYYLHKMWDDNLEILALNENGLMQCFSSGWIEYEGHNGKEYLKDLTDIMPFFKGCQSVEQWQERLEELLDIHDKAIKPFLKHADERSDEMKRWHNLMGNPFHNLSMFSVKPERLLIITNMINKLLSTGKMLFDGDHEIDIVEHFEKLNSILNVEAAKSEAYKEEVAIINELFKQITNSRSVISKCFPEDVAEAMIILIGGGFEEEENINQKRVGIVYPLLQIDAAAIKNNSRVHICLCDAERMPGKASSYPWPITDNFVAELLADSSIRENTTLINMCAVMSSKSLCNRYFFYTALNNRDVELSWIERLDGKPKASSPYIKLINRFSEVNVKNYKLKAGNVTFDEALGRENVSVIGKEFKLNKNIPNEAVMDYALCSLRYLYGYVLQELPSYSSEFQQGYVITGLLKALTNLSFLSTEEVVKQILSLFPNQRRIELKQYIDYAYSDKDDGSTEFDDTAYTDERYKVHFPNEDILKIAKEAFARMYTSCKELEIDLYKATEVKNACIFCPNIDYCRVAIHSLDQEDYYE